MITSDLWHPANSNIEIQDLICWGGIEHCPVIAHGQFQKRPTHRDETGENRHECLRIIQPVINQLESKYAFSKFAKAVDLLNSAAEIFEKTGMYSEAAEVTEILESLAKLNE